TSSEELSERTVMFASAKRGDNDSFASGVSMCLALHCCVFSLSPLVPRGERERSVEYARHIRGRGLRWASLNSLIGCNGPSAARGLASPRCVFPSESFRSSFCAPG